MYMYMYMYMYVDTLCGTPCGPVCGRPGLLVWRFAAFLAVALSLRRCPLRGCPPIYRRARGTG